MMNLLNSLRIVTVNSLKCKRSILTSSSVKFVHQLQTAASTLNEETIVTNIREKLCCTEDTAKSIYKKFPSLRSIDAIRNDSLEMLREKVSLQSIVENPSLVTMDVGKIYITLITSAPGFNFAIISCRHFGAKDGFT